MKLPLAVAKQAGVPFLKKTGAEGSMPINHQFTLTQKQVFQREGPEGIRKGKWIIPGVLLPFRLP